MIVFSLAFRLVHFSGPIAIPLTAIGYQFIPENVYGVLRLQRLCMLAEYNYYCGTEYGSMEHGVRYSKVCMHIDA